MIACDTYLKVVLFGGAQDGDMIKVSSGKETVKVGVNIYADSFFMDKDANSVFFCKKGPGRLRKKVC